MWRRVKTGFDILSTVLVCVAAVAVLWQVTRPARRPSGRPSVEKVSNLSIPSTHVSNVRGTGKIALVEFADFECPFCIRHAKETGPSIKADLLDSGQIRHVFFSFPLSRHPHAQKASEAAECAAKQGLFWEMHERLFENQELDAADLVKHADSAGLDHASFTECLDSDEMANKVRRDHTEGRRLGVNSTPAFFVGTFREDGTIDLVTRINGAVSYEEFKDAVRELQPIRRALLTP